MTLVHGGGGGGGRSSAGGFRRLEPDPVARVWARVSPSLLRPPLVFRSVAGAAAMAERGLEPSPAAVAALPPEVRAQLAELELELSEGRRATGRASGRRPVGGWAGGARRSSVATRGWALIVPSGARRTRGPVSGRQSCALRLTPCPSAAFLLKGGSPAPSLLLQNEAQGNAAAAFLPAPLTMRGASPVTGVRKERGSH